MRSTLIPVNGGFAKSDSGVFLRLGRIKKLVSGIEDLISIDNWETPHI